METSHIFYIYDVCFFLRAPRGLFFQGRLHLVKGNDELLKKLDDLIAQYGRIGGNLNQIARHLNEFSVPYTDLEKEVRDAAVDLSVLKYEILEKVAATVGNVQTHKL